MKKTTQLTYKIIVALSMLAFSLTFNACTKEGPTGPAGADANITCGVCHSDNADDFNLKSAQYDLSLHNKGIVYEEEAGRIACGGCHSGDGFAQAVALGQDDPTTVATAKINCKTCHKIHTKHDTTDFALRFTGDFKMRINAKDVSIKGAGALCSKCHQGRAYTRNPGVADTLKASGTATYSRFGPHYGTIANIFTMNGPYQIAGSTNYPTINQHASLDDACVSCHLGKMNTNPAVGGHTFRIPFVTASSKLNASNFKDIAECKKCHSDSTFFTNPLPKANEIKTLLAEYRTLLINKGWLDISQTTGADGSYNVLGEYMAANAAGKIYSKADGDVVLNYLYLAKEKSFGVHNPLYVYALVKNGLEYLKK